MNDIDLYWFSGTGNTLLVAREMSEQFQQAGLSVRLRRMETADPAAIDPARTLGLAMTVAVSSTYPVVWDFIDALPAVEGTAAFMVDTVAHTSGGILGPVRDALTAKGFTPLGAREIIMPANFLMRSDDADHNRRVRQDGLAAARSYADDLLAGEVSWRKNSLSQRLNCRFARDRAAWKLVRAIFDVGVLPERCTRCGLCQRLCPVRNIVQPGDQPPQFAGRCIACQRCFAFCPTGAIYSRRPGHVKPYRAVSADDILQAP